jgi:hypothetical protein
MNFMRAGGDSSRILSKIIELLKSKKGGVKKNATEEKKVDGYKIEFVSGVYTAETPLGRIVTKPTKDKIDCFFSALLPYIKDEFAQRFPAFTPAGKEKAVTAKRLRSYFEKKYDGKDDKMINISDATKFAADFNIYLFIVDENGNLINGGKLDSTAPDNFKVATILLYKNHYFTLYSKNIDRARLLIVLR